jgi:trehalose 6-phosphate phosphatase
MMQTEPPVAAAIPLENLALFVDLDGTLAPFEMDPAAVVLDDDGRELLRETAARLEGRLAILSGRTIDDIDRITGANVASVCGVHGLQRRLADGALLDHPPHPRVDEATEALRAYAEAEPSLVVETKTVSTALHYRAAPDCEHAVHDLAERLARRTGLELVRGDCVVELRSPGPDKGWALKAFMREAPFRGKTPVFIGDDLTDESGFEAARALGGAGLLVGRRDETEAQASVADPAGVRRRIRQALRIGVFNTGEPEWGD